MITHELNVRRVKFNSYRRLESVAENLRILGNELTCNIFIWCWCTAASPQLKQCLFARRFN